MIPINKIRAYIKNPLLAVPFLGRRGFFNWMSDERYIRLCYKANIGKWPDLDNPQTFNEKLQWLKIHDRNPLYTQLVDKCAVKEWVADKIGSQYVTRTLARWDCVEDIDISGLPERFVLKTNHDSGGIAICRDKATFDVAAARKKLKKHMKRNLFWAGREWPYKNVKPCVFAEEYLESDDGNVEMTDYKFYCFNGEPKFLYVSQGLEDHATARISFLNPDWSFAPFRRTDYAPFEELPKKPASYEEMLRLSRSLSEGISFVRVDFYVCDGNPRFSEMTFTPCLGFMPFEPEEWDAEFGSWICLDQAFCSF